MHTDNLITQPASRALANTIQLIADEQHDRVLTMFTKHFGRFTATYSKGDAYITVYAFGREVDVINISHIDKPTLTRYEFNREVADSAKYIDSAYATEDILMLPLG